MEDGLYELSEDDLSNFADLQCGIKYGNDALVHDSLEDLQRFGTDIKQVETRINGILEGNIVLRENYEVVLEGRDEIVKFLRGMPSIFTAQRLGIDEGWVRKHDHTTERRIDLEKQLGIETAHLGKFGRQLINYLHHKVFANYKNGELFVGREFVPNSEYEDYIVKSDLCAKLQEVLLEDMPYEEIWLKKIRDSEKRGAQE